MFDELILATLVAILIVLLKHTGLLSDAYDRTFGHKRMVMLNRDWNKMLMQKISQFRDWCKK